MSHTICFLSLAHAQHRQNAFTNSLNFGSRVNIHIPIIKLNFDNIFEYKKMSLFKKN
jgi:hypothetical protein